MAEAWCICIRRAIAWQLFQVQPKQRITLKILQRRAGGPISVVEAGLEVPLSMQEVRLKQARHLHAIDLRYLARHQAFAELADSIRMPSPCS